jgi:glycosyltransferase involved in cell wall biosynthesis
MRLSVLINNYNYGRYLRQCIDSVLSQDYPDFEVVVVDDGSSDDSRDVIASYGDSVVPVLKENGGQASCFNAGYAAASGDIQLLLDADDMFLPGKLGRVADVFERHGVDWCFDRVTMAPDAVVSDEVAVTQVDKRASMRRGIFPSIPVPTSGLSFRKTLLAQILPMPLAQGVVLSDNYLKFAAAYLGRGALVETPLTYQRLHASNRYTNTRSGSTLRPRIMVETGYQLANRYREMSPLGVKLIAAGLAERDFPLRAVAGEIRRCTSGGAFGRLGAARISTRFLLKKLAGLRASRAVQ